MAGCPLVGLFAESIHANVTTTAIFEQVSVSQLLTPALAEAAHLPEAESGDQVEVYPNLTRGKVNINLDVYAGKPSTIQVFNALGEWVTQDCLVPSNLKIHNLRIAGAAGVYTVVIQLDGRRILRRMVVDPNGGKQVDCILGLRYVSDTFGSVRHVTQSNPTIPPNPIYESWPLIPSCFPDSLESLFY